MALLQMKILPLQGSVSVGREEKNWEICNNFQDLETVSISSIHMNLLGRIGLREQWHVQLLSQGMLSLWCRRV